ncbi:MAG: ABC transporter ATP-binding protein [Proteobacteria bacterium]|nr:ABC transporter ATP-binding protein [Pseudomonadota bacterium]MBU1687997.1 ABC transporter ATP-binding protein [Pseudomonadota bacterium]
MEKKVESSSASPPALATANLTKTFGGFTAVDSVSLSVNPGEIFGFLGPNGAGKTTTIKIMAGLLQPDSGTVQINGLDLALNPRECKQRTGYIPDRPYLYEKLSGDEFLQFIASLYALPAEQYQRLVPEYLEMFDLTEWRYHLIESFSHGMRQKLIITSAFMLAPPLIIVDEPMVGLDPKSARIVKELFKKHARNGGAVFLSTHSLEIAEELCDRIAIIMKGQLLATGNMTELREKSSMAGSNLEDIFLQLTGAYELQEIISALRAAGS